VSWLYGFAIDFVVFRVRADEPDVGELHGKFDYGDQPVIIAFDVEHIPLISDAVRRVEGFFDVGIAGPLAFHDLLNPILQGGQSLRMFPAELFQCLFGEYSHRIPLSRPTQR
jgi:hypothetical protein